MAAKVTMITRLQTIYRVVKEERDPFPIHDLSPVV
jgi:hypothetical protein